MDIAKVNILGQAVKTNDEMVSLTDLWKASGADSKKKPVEWLRGDEASNLLKTLKKTLKGGKSHLLETRKGRPGRRHGDGQGR